MLPSDYEIVFTSLPLTGKLEKEPWADSYWPSREGGLAQRWRDGVAGHEVSRVSWETAKQMTDKDLSRLSPAEKFDIFVGSESFNLFSSELTRTSPSDDYWFGICHGWAPAALAFNEPKAIKLKGPSGIEVPFGSSDVKALLSLYAGDYAKVKSQMLAARCNDDFSKNPESAKKPNCRDTNAGAFHLVLTNLIGLQKKGFVADLTRDFEVWNQPVSGFETKILKESRGRSQGAALWTAREITVETTIHYGAEISPEWKALGSNMRSRTYQYRLELNRRGMIIGGAWLTDERPDFLWTNSTPDFEDAASRTGNGKVIEWSKLQLLYDASAAAGVDLEEP